MFVETQMLKPIIDFHLVGKNVLKIWIYLRSG